MNAAASLGKRKGYIKSSDLVIFAFATAFFPRLLAVAGGPSAVNFIHFATVPFVCGFVLAKTRTKNRSQIAAAQALLFGLMLFLTIGFASALLNGAGVINLILVFLLWTEPFMLLLAIVCIPMSRSTLERFRAWILGFGLFNIWFSLFQKFVLHWDTCYCAPGAWADGDAIKGVFLNQGSGHVVSASVSSSLAIYYYLTAKNRPAWVRVGVAIAGLSNIIISQANQVVVILVIAFALLSLVNLKDFGKAFLYILGTVVFISAFSWAIEHIEALSTFQTWIRPEIYGPDGEATLFKLSGIRIIIANYHSPLNWFLGLGPGHTIDRLGGWMLKDYSDLLSPLGSTRFPVADQVWAYMGSSWLANGSSFFAPFFGWAAIWGDVGWLGLAAYLYICAIVWRQICLDDLSKFLMLTVFVVGLIFTQMQEPGYMLFMASLIGLQWQTNRIKLDAASF